jgi:hypothetical protein
LLKFDGVSGNKDKELEDPQGYGLIELAYSRMARAAKITMSDCRLLEENGRNHVMTLLVSQNPQSPLGLQVQNSPRESCGSVPARSRQAGST